MTAQWTPGFAWQGFEGIIHGGIVSTVLDEAMAKAAAVFARKAVTAEMTVRFRLPVQPGQELAIRGWVVELTRRRIRTEASIAYDEGREFAHASATFLPAKEPSK